MRVVPTLETERLILRPIRPEDFEPFAAFMATQSSRFIGGPCDRVEAWRRLASYAGGWTLNGFGKFSLEEKTSGRFVGLVGPWFPEGWPEAEISWTLMSEFQGKGYAQEAALRSLHFAYSELGWKTAVSCVDPANAPSIRLAERLGALPEGMTEIKPHGPALVFRHMPPAEILATFEPRQGAA